MTKLRKIIPGIIPILPSSRGAPGLAFLVFVGLGVTLEAAWYFTHPPRRGSVWRRPGEAQKTWQTSDGVRIAGTCTTPLRAPCVVLTHGYRGHRGQVQFLRQQLMAAGFAVIDFDFRGHGASAPVAVTTGRKEAADLDAVLTSIKQQVGSLEQVSLIGLSMGAAATTYSELAPELGRIVLVAGYAELDGAWRRRMQIYMGFDPWPLDWPLRKAAEAFAGIKIVECQPAQAARQRSLPPALLVYGSADRRAPVQDGILLRDALSAARLVEFPQSHQQLSRFSRAPAVVQSILSFLRSSKS